MHVRGNLYNILNINLEILFYKRFQHFNVFLCGMSIKRLLLVLLYKSNIMKIFKKNLIIILRNPNNSIITENMWDKTLESIEIK